MASNKKLVANLAYLQEIYIRHINEILQPLIYEVLTKTHLSAINDYNKAKGREKKSIVMYFQERLALYVRTIKSKEDEYEEIIKSISLDNRELLEKLMFSLFEKFIQAHTPRMNKALRAELIPTRHEVYYTLFTDICREIWARAYLFDDRNISDTERQRNLNDIKTLISSKIKEGLQKLMPLKMLIKLTQDEEFPEDISEPISKNQRAKLNKLLQEGGGSEEEDSDEESEEESEDEESASSDEEESSGSDEEEEESSEDEQVAEVGEEDVDSLIMDKKEEAVMPPDLLASPELEQVQRAEQVVQPLVQPITVPVVPEQVVEPITILKPIVPEPIVLEQVPEPSEPQEEQQEITPALVIKRTVVNSKSGGSKHKKEHVSTGPVEKERVKDSVVAKKKLLF